MKRIVVCPGSFDPVTFGHIEIIKRASQMFDHVIVAVLRNFEKNPIFTDEERVNFLKQVTKDIENIEIVCFSGLLVDFAKEKNAVAVVKGLRAVSDFEYEFQMSITNRKLNPDLETVFFTSSAENMYLSSSIVKQVARLNGDITNFVPACIHDEIKARLCNPNNV